MGDMLHTEPIVRIFLVLRRLDVNSALGILTTPTVVRLFRYIFEYSVLDQSVPSQAYLLLYL